jgi:hypothetical protein
MSNFIFSKKFPIFPLKMTNFSKKKIIGLKQSFGEKGGRGYFHIFTLKNVVLQLQIKLYIYMKNSLRVYIPEHQGITSSHWLFTH